MKSNADVKTLPTTEDEHLSWKVPKELEVGVYDQYGTQWAYITSDDQEYAALRPVGEGQSGSDQQRRVLIEFADQVEQQLAARLAERQIAEFVDDDEIVAQQLLGQPATATGGLLLLQLIDEVDQIEEASSGAGANDRRGHCETESAPGLIRHH